MFKNKIFILNLNNPENCGNFRNKANLELLHVSHEESACLDNAKISYFSTSKHTYTYE